MSYDIKITKGPFFLIDEYPEAWGWGSEEEHFAYNFTINGHKGVLGEDHESFRYLIPNLSDSFVVENWTSKRLASLVGKALDTYEANNKIKSELSSDTLKTFGELIDEL